jgi:hypothetical protein
MAAQMTPRKPVPALILAVMLGGALAACETAPMDRGFGAPWPRPAPGPAVFNAEDFAWSTRAGSAAIDGRIDYRRNGRAFDCTGSVGLTPDTPYTRARIRTLYGSTDRAAVPEAIVRARTVADPSADYRSYVRSTTCQNDRFTFSGLPNGGWFVIVPVSAGGDDRVVLMRHVVTRNGRVSVTL